MSSTDTTAETVLESYNTPLYQRIADLEARADFGMSPDEKYKREVGLALDQELADTSGRNLSTELSERVRKGPVRLVDRLDLSIDSNSTVLDLACGEGDSTRIIAAETGATVIGSDFAAELIRVAERKTGTEALVEDARRRIQFVVGDMGNTNELLGKALKGHDTTVDAVTIFGRSFGYLGSHEAHQQALHRFFDALKPGGSLVMQWREHPHSPDSSIAEGQHVFRYTEGAEDEPQNSPERIGAKRNVIRDEVRRDGYSYTYSKARGADTGEPVDTLYLTRTYLEPERPGDVTGFNEKGECLDAAGEIVPDKVTPLNPSGPMPLKNYLATDNLNLLHTMLSSSGFTNIRVKGQNLTTDGSTVIFAIAADKPV
ncbi:MAG: class I SAM-dependent methyltransferase [Candidatus Peregrinibacteria bacterium]